MTADEAAAALIPDGATRHGLGRLRPRLPRRGAGRDRPALRQRPAIRATSPRCIRSPPATCGASAASTTWPSPACSPASSPAPIRPGPPRPSRRAIWRMIEGDEIPAYNIPSGILFDMHREAAAKRPGVLTKVGLDTFVDPHRQGCAMNARAAAEPDRPPRRFRRARTGCSSRRSCPTSRSSGPPRPTSAATSPSSTKAPISARSIRRWPCATTAASSSPR